MESPGDDWVLRLRGVSRHYRDTVALEGVDLEVRAGEVVALLGRSGAGKSTLLRCVNHLAAPSSGHVELPDLGRVDGGPRLREHRRRTGMVFQDHHLLLRLTALQNVLLARVPHRHTLRCLLPAPRADREIALAALGRVGLLAKASQQVRTLSGGQRQRVGIARALAQQPSLMLADEPVASLDPATAHDVLGALSSICREDGIAMVVSLHQPELARLFADRVLGLAHGRVVLERAVSDLSPADLDRLYRGDDHST